MNLTRDEVHSIRVAMDIYPHECGIDNGEWWLMYDKIDRLTLPDLKRIVQTLKKAGWISDASDIHKIIEKYETLSDTITVTDLTVKEVRAMMQKNKEENKMELNITKEVINEVKKVLKKARKTELLKAFRTYEDKVRSAVEDLDDYGIFFSLNSTDTSRHHMRWFENLITKYVDGYKGTMYMSRIIQKDLMQGTAIPSFDLNFVGAGNTGETNLAVGKEIVKTFEKHGVKVEWCGHTNQLIHIKR